MFAYSDQTIRVAKMPTGPVRELPRRFARTAPRRWPYLVAAVVALAALVTPLAIARHADRSAEARAVLRLLGR